LEEGLLLAVFCPSFRPISDDLNDRFECKQTFRILLSKIERRAAGSRSIAAVTLVG
jgi:hypothetical protein